MHIRQVVRCEVYGVVAVRGFRVHEGVCILHQGCVVCCMVWWQCLGVVYMRVYVYYSSWVVCCVVW